MKRSFLIVFCLMVFGNILCYSTSYHITNKSEFMSSSSWAMKYDTVYLDNDIDLEGDAFTPITKFVGVFDGQGHTISGLNVVTTNSNACLFSLVYESTIRNFKIYGNITSNSTSNQARTALIASVGKSNVKTDTLMTNKPTIIENIENHLNLTTNGPRPDVAGFVAWKNMGVYQMYILNCQYYGTINVNYHSVVNNYVFNSCAGILGVGHPYDMISDCLYAGTININNVPVRSAINKEGYNYDGNLGGIAGYFGKENGTNAGIKNCLSVGSFNLGGNHFKNQGAVAGIIHKDADTDNNYFCNDTLTNGSTTGRDNSGTSSSTQVTEEDVQNGTVCSELNKGGGTWGQTIGENGYPSTSNDNIITKDNEGTCSITTYTFDDNCDVTVFPSNVNEILINTVNYIRPAKYVKGVMSICLPFEVSKNDGTLPAGEIYEYSYSETDENGYVTNVHFRLKSDQTTIKAGEAVFFKPAIENVDWVVEKHNVHISTLPQSNNVGINGVFNTTKIGTGYFKLNGSGDNLVYTNANSKCYPYRCYVKLPDGYIIQGTSVSSTNQVCVRISLNNNSDVATKIENESINGNNAKKIYKNGIILLLINNNIYTLDGRLYE